MNPLVALAVQTFIKIVLGSDLFSRINALVGRWADRQIDGAAKRHGVMADLEIIGIQSAEWAIRLAIELAVGKLKGFDTSPKA